MHILFAEGLDTPYLILMLAGAGSVIALLFRFLIGAKDATIKVKDEVIAAKEKETALAMKIMEERLLESEELKKVFSEVAAEAVRSANETQNYYRQKEGKPPLVLPPAVIAEGNSPSTPRQLEIAQAASMRAAVAAIKAEAGQSPRLPPGKPLDLQGGIPGLADERKASEEAKKEPLIDPDKAVEIAGKAVVAAATATIDAKKVLTNPLASKEAATDATKAAGEASIVASAAVEAAKKSGG